jgi:hypothetical protein
LTIPAIAVVAALVTTPRFAADLRIHKQQGIFQEGDL